METFGEMLRAEREHRDLSIPDVAGILGVDEDRLRALERNDFEALPDEDAMVATLQAYAECLKVDAEMMIEDYRRERENVLRRLAETVTEQAPEISPAVMPSVKRPQPGSPRVLAPFVILGVLGLIGVWWVFSGDETTPTPERPVAAPPVETAPAPTETRAAVASTPPVRPVERPTPTRSESLGLSITHQDVGTGIEDRQLVGQRDRFTAGTQVWFWNLVEGGSSGDKIDHVWLREGVEVARIPLTLGGPRWRTYSSKTLRAGSAGKWAVEARDDTGRVLAHREFTCAP
jgi:transcriptional regulator with XRE-family HTH domain